MRPIDCAMLALLALLPLSAAAEENTHGCACFHNKTKAAISYRYKWGDGQWKVVKLLPGYEEALCWRYGEGGHSSPPLAFQLDVDMTSGNAWTTYSITRVQAPANRCEVVGQNGHYDIGYRPDTNYNFIRVTHR